VVIGYLFESHTTFFSEFLKTIKDLLVVERTGLTRASTEEGEAVGCISLPRALWCRDQLLVCSCWVENISFDEFSSELGGLRGSFSQVL
jgi:hypothetical protein